MPLLANAGTPLIWAGLLWLVVGNFALGWVEAWLLGKLLRRRIPAGMLVAANYASMLLGAGLASLATPIREQVERDPIRLGLPVFAGMAVVAWLVTVFLEWPFLARAAGEPVGKRTFALSAAVQTVTYVAMFGLSLALGSISALTSWRESESLATVSGWLYWVGSDDRTVYRTRLDGSRTERVAQTQSPVGSWDRIVVAPDARSNRSQLMCVSRSDPEEVLAQVGSAGQAAPLRFFEGRAELGNVTFGPGSVRAFSLSPSVVVGFWPVEGIVIEGNRYGLETPFLSLQWRSAVVLPDGKVVAQFGRAILLLDPATGRARKLAEGSGGDVLLDEGIGEIQTSRGAGAPARKYTGSPFGGLLPMVGHSILYRAVPMGLCVPLFSRGNL